MARRELFFISLFEMLALGAVILYTIMMWLAALYPSPAMGIQGIQNFDMALDGIEEVLPDPEEFLQARTSFLLAVAEFVILLGANLCLVYATKDASETPRQVKKYLLNMWKIIIGIYNFIVVCAFLLNVNWAELATEDFYLHKLVLVIMNYITFIMVLAYQQDNYSDDHIQDLDLERPIPLK